MKSIAYTAFITLLFFSCSRDQPQIEQNDRKPYTDIYVSTFIEQFERAGSDTLLLDVRTQEEFESGHIPGAIHLHVDDPEFNTKASRLDSSKTIVVYCRTGVRSVTASETLSGELGFTDVHNLLGGFTEWKEYVQGE